MYRSKWKTAGIILCVVFICILIGIPIGCFLGLSGVLAKPKVIDDVTKYEECIDSSGKGKYAVKWMEDTIFPATVSNKKVRDFRFIYYNPFDAQYLAYLVVDYKKSEYESELKRLHKEGINRFEGYWDVTGF
ncbi:MAG: hypothetical protein IJI67_04210 [Clostridia bacterium]|nr:hypothetical protein [Clostridia bacterium]